MADYLETPTSQSKVIEIKLNPLDFSASKGLIHTYKKFQTTDTDAWLSFIIEGLDVNNGQYSLALINKDDGSIFQRRGEAISNEFSYKMNATDTEENEIKHAGRWIGQLVIELDNGNTTTVKFAFDIEGHILDGKDARAIIIQDFQTLMSQLNDLKDELQIDVTNLKEQLEQNNANAEALITELDAMITNDVVSLKVGEKYEALEAEYADQLTSVTAQLAQKVGYGVKAELEDLSADVLGAIDGTGGPFELLSIPQDQSVTTSKLTDQYNYNGQISSTGDMNSAIKTGVYLVTSPPANSPEEFKSGSGVLEVSNAGGSWIKQAFYNNSDKANSYIRMYDTTGSYIRDWVLLTDNPNVNYLTSSDDVNDYLKDGKWVTISAMNQPVSGTFVMKVSTFATALTGGNYWGTQTFTSTNTSNSAKYERVFYHHSVNGVQYSPYMRLDGETQVVEETKPLEVKIIVNLGDSLFGNTRGATSVSAFIAERTGATVHNIGFGGSRIAQHSEYWDAFSLYRLADEIVKDDADATKWQLQDEAIAARQAGLVPGMPSYFDEHLADLKAIDFSQVDYITIAGGTNDYTASVYSDNETDKYDTTSMGGSLRYSLEKIYTAYQHLNVLICSPLYRFWRDENGNFIEDSDTKEYLGETLPIFVEVQRSIAKEYKTPFLDNYYDLGINKFNKEEYFPSTDGTHPNATGNAKLGSKIGIELVNAF